MDAPRWSRRDLLALAGAGGLSALGLRARPARAAAGYRDLVLSRKPAGYWRLGEREGPTARDASPHERHGAYQGPVRFHERGAIARDDDTSIRLNGRDAYVEVPDNEHFSQPASGKGLTVEVWLRPTTLVFDGETAEHYVHWLGKGEPGALEWGLRFYSRRSSRPNRISAYIWNPAGGLGAGAYVQGDVERGAWVHVVACYDPGDRTNPGAGVSIYRDGVLRGSPKTQKGALYSSYDVMPAHGKAPLRFGTRDRVSYLAGGLDEVAVYPRVLTAAEIREHYRVATGR
jgi:hypothetical protein